MGVELDFEEPTALRKGSTGSGGNEPSGTEHKSGEAGESGRVPPASLSSLKWATYYDRTGLLGRHGVGLSDDSIQPDMLVKGCVGALRELAELVAEGDDELRAAVDRGEGWHELKHLFWGSGARTKQLGGEIAASQWAHLLSQMLDAGEAGWAARWNF